MTEKKVIPTRIWVVLLAAVFIAAVCASWLMGRTGSRPTTARIYQDGVLIREIDLNAVGDGWEFTVECADGFNTISVRPGGICVSQADCSDGTCMKQGWLEGGITPIVCLPHALVIQLEPQTEYTEPDTPEIDAVAG